MSEPGRPPRLVHQVDRRACGHSCLERKSEVARRAHRVRGIAGHAEAPAQRGTVLETACREKRTDAGADCAAATVLFDHRADEPSFEVTNSTSGLLR